MKIAIIGAGYVGLTSAAVLADLGHTVWAVRKDADKIEMLKQGEIPFYEPGLAEIVKKNVLAGRLIPTLDYKEAVPPAEVIFICVGTPCLPSGEADLSQVFAAAREIAENLNDFKIIVDKSTVPVGTAEKVRKEIQNVLRAGGREIKFEMASCPEFLRQGSAVLDTMKPSRVVIGADSERAKNILLELHQPFPGERVVTDIQTAEMIKYAANAFLATKISFINEIANLCDEVKANVDDLALGIGLDPRIGSAFLKAGVGYGGSCFPKDTRALHAIALNYNYEFKLLKAVIEVNQMQRRYFLQKVRGALDSLENKKIGVLGLAFKDNTDDVRESAALDIISQLIKDGALVKAYDSQAEKNAKTIIPQLATCLVPEEVADGADALLILTEWPEFKNLDWRKIKEKMRQPLVIDGRNLLNPKEMRALGFKYLSVGRP